MITRLELEGRMHVYGLYTVRVKDRGRFYDQLNCQGIPTAIHYSAPLKRQSAFEYSSAFCPVSDRLSNEVVSLPMCLYSE